jgi:hypothetical protein
MKILDETTPGPDRRSDVIIYLCFSGWRSRQSTLHHFYQFSSSNGFLENGERPQAQRLSFDIRPPKCRDDDNRQFRQGTGHAKTPRPLNIGIRRSVITKSNRFSESASSFTTTSGSDTAVTCMPSLASTLVIARSIPRSSSTTKTHLSCNSSIIFSKNSTVPHGKSPRCNNLPHQQIQPSRGDYQPVAEVRHLEQENRHIMRQQPTEVEC